MLAATNSVHYTLEDDRARFALEEAWQIFARVFI
jgi:hypothetical protein